MNDQTKGLLLTTFGVLFVVPDALFIRLIVADPLTIAFWRMLLTGVVTLIGFAIIYKGKTLGHIRTIGRYGMLYALFAGISSILFVLAVRTTSVANVVFIIAAMPVFAALYSWFLLGESPSKRMVWTIFLVIIGIVVIALGSGESENTSWIGDLIAICTAACFAMALTAARKARPISMIPAVPVAYIGAALVILPFCDPLSIQQEQYWLVGLHGGFFIAISSCLLALGPRYITSAEVALLILLESILAPLIVWAILGEEVGIITLVGGAIVIGVLFVSNLIVLLRPRKRQKVKLDNNL